MSREIEIIELLDEHDSDWIHVLYAWLLRSAKEMLDESIEVHERYSIEFAHVQQKLAVLCDASASSAALPMEALEPAVRTDREQQTLGTFWHSFYGKKSCEYTSAAQALDAVTDAKAVFHGAHNAFVADVTKALQTLEHCTPSVGCGLCKDSMPYNAFRSLQFRQPLQDFLQARSKLSVSEIECRTAVASARLSEALQEAHSRIADATSEWFSARYSFREPKWVRNPTLDDDVWQVGWTMKGCLYTLENAREWWSKTHLQQVQQLQGPAAAATATVAAASEPAP